MVGGSRQYMSGSLVRGLVQYLLVGIIANPGMYVPWPRVGQRNPRAINNVARQLVQSE